MKKILARITLIALVIAAMVGIAMVPIHLAHDLWPLDHHTHLGIFLVVLLSWIAVVIALLALAVAIIGRLLVVAGWAKDSNNEGSS